MLQRCFRSAFVFNTRSSFVAPFAPTSRICQRSYCTPAGEEEELEEDVPEGVEWTMLRQIKKTTKKRLEAKRKTAKAWRKIVYQAWTNMYKPEDAVEMIKALKQQSKYDDKILTPKDGDRFTRVFRARQIQEHNHARSLKVFPQIGGGRRRRRTKN